MNYKKLLIGVLIGIIVVGIGYFSVHTYANNKVLEKYAAGYEKNRLGDYTKNESDMVIAVYKPPLFQSYTNISISSKEKVDLLMWVPLYGGDLSYGIVVTDDEKEQRYEIEVNDHLEAKNPEDQEILKNNEETIQELKAIAKKEWGINL
ncbi:hypothetical protein IA826_09040 [Listeria seeligeri]|uniref:hypothetical protein n=1 Tax=Listeria seeligeri TaxID=1640 RepID=UPI00162832F3|nr:hypothetical protein [Listeria seeligeri]MBC2072005.1 hypothetical protein [Listeria seeligeri]MBC2086965.1 hypothetical protein [Listeria seeligeri]MBC2247428.1 hypothetical protein [Listeria seeligeri]MBF2376884.1 hypothetical protein [Listeria seeligeri]MBF2401862.1 hypothetical protein [Listeria seeligeri]